jgi:copper chaperone CopZ
VERALNELGDGIQSKEVNLDTKQVNVTYDVNKVSVDSIKNAIEDAGYDVE